MSAVEPDTEQSSTVTDWRRQVRPLGTMLATRSGAVVVALLVGLVAGLLVARSLAEDEQVDARRAVESTLLPLAVDADGIWTSSSESRGAVSDALVALRRGGSARQIERDLEAWLEAYDLALLKIAGLHLPPGARPVQRQVISGITLSRDAVEVLGHAAAVHALPDQQGRVEDLLEEVGRLRLRSEQLLQAARAAPGDLSGQVIDVGPLGPVPDFSTPRP